MPNILEMRSGHRSHTGRVYDDYYINGDLLSEILEIKYYLTPFGGLASDLEKQHAQVILGICDSDFKPGRIPLFLCSECADYGCGGLRMWRYIMRD